jgi:hypothetical protein
MSNATAVRVVFQVADMLSSAVEFSTYSEAEAIEFCREANRGNDVPRFQVERGFIVAGRAV